MKRRRDQQRGFQSVLLERKFAAVGLPDGVSCRRHSPGPRGLSLNVFMHKLSAKELILCEITRLHPSTQRASAPQSHTGLPLQVLLTGSSPSLMSRPRPLKGSTSAAGLLSPATHRARNGLQPSHEEIYLCIGIVPAIMPRPPPRRHPPRSSPTPCGSPTAWCRETHGSPCHTWLRVRRI